jgi:hypothetical protein
MASKLLSIYLNDHLAGATVGVELARRARGSNEGTPLGTWLAGLTREIEEDRETLQRLMEELGVKQDHVKTHAAWVGEKLGRLKLNGRLTGYSPLSRLVELEGLHVGITGKLDMWQSLDRSLGADIGSFDFKQLAERAERQAREVEEHRLEAAAEALS